MTRQNNVMHKHRWIYADQIWICSCGEKRTADEFNLSPMGMVEKIALVFVFALAIGIWVAYFFDMRILP